MRRVKRGCWGLGCDARWAIAPLVLLLSCGGPPSRVEPSVPSLATSHEPTRDAEPAASATADIGVVPNEGSTPIDGEPVANDDPPPAVSVDASPSADGTPSTVAPRAASPFAPALMRKGVSCWADEATKSGPPLIVIFAFDSVSLSRGRCWNSGGNVISSATRPFFVESMFSCANICVYEEEEAKYSERYEAFMALISQTFDLKERNGRAHLLGEKGQTLARLRSLTKAEKAEHCPQLTAASDAEVAR